MKEVALPLLFNLSYSSLLVLLMIPISYALRFHITNSGEQHSRAVFFLRSDEEAAAAKKKVVQFIDAIACGDQREQSTGREGIFHATPWP